MHWHYGREGEYMINYGKHKITPTTPLPPPPPPVIGPIHKFINVVFFTFIILGSIKSCTEPTQRPSAPTPPTPPTPGLAVFSSANLLATPLSIVLGGGNYELIYQTANNLAAQLQAFSSNSVFTANFDTGIASGNLDDADVLILVGSLKLQVGTLDKNDSLYANILSRGKEINAYFNYSTSPRGPPINAANRSRKQIIIIGELKHVEMGDSYGDSTRDIRILDLNPSDEDEKKYKEATSRYDSEIFKYKEKQTIKALDDYSRRGEPPFAHRY